MPKNWVKQATMPCKTQPLKIVIEKYLSSGFVYKKIFIIEYNKNRIIEKLSKRPI